MPTTSARCLMPCCTSIPISCPTIIRRSLPYTNPFSVRCTCWTRGQWLHSCSDCQDKKYLVRWMPAYIDAQAKELVEALEGLVPASLVKVKPTARSAANPWSIRRSGWYRISLDVGQILVGQLRPYAAPPVLLQGRTHALRRSGRKRNTRGIRSWTASYTLTASDYRPVFSVEESRKEVSTCTSAWRTSENRSRRPYPYAKCWIRRNTTVSDCVS